MANQALHIQSAQDVGTRLEHDTGTDGEPTTPRREEASKGRDPEDTPQDAASDGVSAPVSDDAPQEEARGDEDGTSSEPQPDAPEAEPDTAESAGVTARAAPPVRWWEIASYAALLLVAAASRLWDLGSRAIHHDESLHAYYSWILSNGFRLQARPDDARAVPVRGDRGGVPGARRQRLHVAAAVRGSRDRAGGDALPATSAHGQAGRLFASAMLVASRRCCTSAGSPATTS